MKSWRLLIFAAVVAVFGVAQARDLTIMGQDYPPFNWSEGNQVKGGMYEVLKAACGKLKYNCKFEIVPLPRALKMLEGGEIDGVMSLIPNPDRAPYSNASPTIISSNIVYMAQKGKPRLNSTSDLSGWTVAGVRAASSLKFAKQSLSSVKNVTFVEENNNEDLVKKMGLGRFGDKSVIVGSEDVFNYFAKKNNAELTPVLDMKVEDFGVNLSKKKFPENEQKKFMETLESMKKSGEMQKILSAYSLKTK